MAAAPSLWCQGAMLLVGGEGSSSGATVASRPAPRRATTWATERTAYLANTDMVFVGPQSGSEDGLSTGAEDQRGSWERITMGTIHAMGAPNGLLGYPVASRSCDARKRVCLTVRTERTAHGLDHHRNVVGVQRLGDRSLSWSSSSHRRPDHNERKDHNEVAD